MKLKKVVNTMIGIYKNNKNLSVYRDFDFDFKLSLLLGSNVISLCLLLLMMFNVMGDYSEMVIALSISFMIASFVGFCLFYHDFVDYVKSIWSITIGKKYANLKYYYYKFNAEKIKKMISENHAELLKEAQKHHCEYYLNELFNGLSTDLRFSEYILDDYDFNNFKKIGSKDDKKEDIFKSLTPNNMSSKALVGCVKEDFKNANSKEEEDENIEFFTRNG